MSDLYRLKLPAVRNRLARQALSPDVGLSYPRGHCIDNQAVFRDFDNNQLYDYQILVLHDVEIV